MRLHIDGSADALYLRLTASDVLESEEVEPGVVLDFDASGNIVGVEILRLSTRLPTVDLPMIHIEATERVLRT